MNNRYVVVILCVVVGGASAGYWYYNQEAQKSSTEEMVQEMPEASTESQPEQIEMVEEKKESGHEENSMQTSNSGLKYTSIKAADAGAAKPQRGQVVTVHYTGWLSEDGKKGTKFDSSVDRGQAFKFVVGVGQVIKGWDEAVLDMQIGEKREVLIPSALGYGAAGAGDIIPPHADLIFDIDVIAAQ